MKILLLPAAAAALALAGCATDSVKPETAVVTQDVVVTTTRSCVPDNVGEAPASYTDNPAAMKAAKSGPDRYSLSVQGSQEKSDRLSVIEPVLAGCRKAGAK